jgi:glucokinase
MQYFIGVDIGGTNIKIGLVNEQGKPLAQHSFPTQSNTGPQAVVDAIASEVKLLAKQAGVAMSDIAGVGIGSPGPLDLNKGIVRATPNLSGWRDVPLRDMVSQATGLPAILENDANAAAMGEFWAGAGRDPEVRFLIMLTLGTGVGCGIVDDGHLIHGANSFAGEGGHVIVQPNGRLCGCGQRGCIEAYASASSVARIAIERLEAGEASSLQDLRKQGKEITSREVFQHAEKGDALALSVVDQTADYLGLLCVSICRLLDPQMIVFAGGMILAGEFLFSRIREAYNRHTWTILKDKVRIVPAELGNDAGFIGAAAVAWDGHRRGALVNAKS